MKSLRTRSIYYIVATLAAVALVLGLWDIVIERDGGERWYWQLGFPVTVLAIALVMIRQCNRSER